jgi:integrase
MASVQEKTKTHGERYYKFTVYLGEKDGKKLRKSRNWTPPKTATGKDMTEKAARELAEKTAYEWERDVLGGNYVTKAITLSELFKEWDRLHLTPNLAPKTSQEYRKQWKRLEPLMGFLKSDKINVKHINTIYADFQKDGANKKTGGKLDVSHFHSMLSSMFSWAIKSEYMTKNPCDNATKPKHEKKSKTVFDFEQAQTLLEKLKHEPLEFQSQISILLVGGIRRGELFGLRWADILPNGVLRVQRSISYIEGQGLLVKSTKTCNIRHIKLPDGILQTLSEYKQEQQERIFNLGDMFTDYDYIFTTDNGTPRHVDGIAKKYKSFLRKCGFSEEIVKAIPLKGLRDTFASLLFASGKDVRTVAGLMGHSQPTMTLNVYGQFLPSQWGAAEETFTPLLSKSEKADFEKFE